MAGRGGGEANLQLKVECVLPDGVGLCITPPHHHQRSNPPRPNSLLSDNEAMHGLGKCVATKGRNGARVIAEEGSPETTAWSAAASASKSRALPVPREGLTRRSPTLTMPMVQADVHW